jgi:hypothetical protein
MGSIMGKSKDWQSLSDDLGPQDAPYRREWARRVSERAAYERKLRRKAPRIGQTEIPVPEEKMSDETNEPIPGEPLAPIYESEGRQQLKAIQRIGPLRFNDQTIGYMCFACLIPFKVGDYTTLVKLGPGNDPVKQECERKKLPYDAVFLQVHFACGTGIPDAMYDEVTVARGQGRN